MLSEALAKKKLAEAGLPVPIGSAASSDQLCEVANEIGYPVVLKMMSPLLAHKTDAGAVALGLTSPEALKNAATKMKQAVTRHSKQAVTDDFLVEAMAPQPLAELVVSIRREAQFGLTMTLGSGGVFVDLMADTVSLILPSSAATIAEALDSLRIAPLLDGFRGKPAVNKDNLVASLSCLADYAMANAETIIEIEINPVFVFENDILMIDALWQSAAG